MTTPGMTTPRETPEPVGVLSRLRARLRGSKVMAADTPVPPSVSAATRGSDRFRDDGFAPVVVEDAGRPRPAGLAPFAPLPPAPPPTPVVANAARCDVRYVAGSLFGLAVGDALGTTLEFQRLAAPPFPTLASGPHRDVIGQGPFQLAAGQVTDDTQMALCLFASLVERGSFDQADVAARYVGWRRHAFDIGAQTAAAIDMLAAGVAPGTAGRAVWEGRDRTPAGNGALMRTAPIGALLGLDGGPRRTASVDDAMITHADPRCLLASVGLNGAIGLAVMKRSSSAPPPAVLAVQAKTEIAAVAQALAAATPELAAVIRAAADALHEDLRLAAADDPQLHGPDVHLHEHQGFVRVAFRLAFWELFHAPSFEAGLIDVVNRGGDADTNGAIAGALLGAYHGIDAIPDRWLAPVGKVRPGPEGGALSTELHPLRFLDGLDKIYIAASRVAAATPAPAVAPEIDLDETPIRHVLPPASPPARPRPWRGMRAEGGIKVPEKFATVDDPQWRVPASDLPPWSVPFVDFKLALRAQVHPLRAAGALLGLAVGDAFGATQQGATPALPPFPTPVTGPQRELVGGGRFGLVAGEVTDDTAAATALASALLADTTGFEAEDAVVRYFEWARGAFELPALAHDALLLCSNGAPAERAGKAVWERAGRQGDDCGALTRAAAAGVLLAVDPDVRRRVIVADTAITHYDPRCQLAGIVVAGGVAHALGAGVTPATTVVAMRSELTAGGELLRSLYPGLRAEVDAAIAAIGADLDAGASADPGLLGAGLHLHRNARSVHVVLRQVVWELAHAPTYETAIIDAGNRGGAADTTAAVTGALFGAIYGTPAIPARWLDRVLAAPGDAGPMWERHPRSFLHTLTWIYGGAGEPRVMSIFAPFVARAFPDLARTGEDWLRESSPMQPWTLPGGVQVVQRLRSNGEVGQYRGRLADGTPVIVSTMARRPDESPQVTAELRLALPGLAPIAGVTAFDDRGAPAQALLEVEPAGVPLATPGFPMFSGHVLPYLAQLLAIVDAAAASGHVYRTLRPEHVYAATLQDGPRITGIIARSSAWLAGAPPRSPGKLGPGVAPLHRALFESPEVLLLAPMHPVSPASDVFSVCAITAFLLHRRTPFERDDDVMQQLAAIRAGSPTLYLGLPDKVADAVVAGLHADPAKRPTARQLLALVAAAGVTPPGPPVFVPAPRVQP
jgi:ADP-ribosyl-[dinitrogen reductase] hydrolase